MLKDCQTFNNSFNEPHESNIKTSQDNVNQSFHPGLASGQGNNGRNTRLSLKQIIQNKKMGVSKYSNFDPQSSQNMPKRKSFNS